MNLNGWIAIWAAFALLAMPALALDEHNNAGGEAEEHRSERAAERSNAQWDEDNEGRPEKRRDGDGEAEQEDGEKKEKREKKEKKDEKEKKGKKGEKDDETREE